MSADFLAMLLETTLATSAAALLVLGLRGTLTRGLGASVAYGAWSLVPVAGLAVLLPAPALQGAALWSALPGPSSSFDLAGQIPWQPWLLLAWVLGACVTALAQWRRQMSFARHLRDSRLRADGLREAAAVTGLPAVTGVLNPRITVPADFDTRYSAAERELILCHERIHIRRCDLQANALATFLRVLFWFNPLLHVAVSRFRRDQELSCDERVIARHPGRRRSYADAMLKTQLAASPLPVGCHWQDVSPLKERIAMLKNHAPGRARSLGGATLMAALCISGGYAAWAAQPAQGASDAPNTVSATRGAGDYPAEAAAAGVGGMVRVAVEVDADGSIRSLQVQSSDPAGVFDAAALEMAGKMKFTPAIKDGQPVARRVVVPIRFEPTADKARAAAGN